MSFIQLFQFRFTQRSEDNYLTSDRQRPRPSHAQFSKLLKSRAFRETPYLDLYSISGSVTVAINHTRQ